MTSKSKLNIALLLAVAFLILIVVYKPGKDSEDKYQISKLDTTSVNHIRLERIEAEPIEFSRVDGKWIMISPYTVATTQINVESLLDLLEYNYHAVYDKDKVELKKYDLDKPHATIIYNKTHRFDFGTTEALNKYRYLSHNDKMYIVDDYFRHRILGTATSFINHALLPKGQNIVQIKFQHLTLKVNDGTWQATPEPEKYSNDQANALIEKWTSIHASSVLKYKKGSEIGKIEVTLEKSDTPIVFALLKIKDFYFLARADLNIMYKISNEQRRDLLQLPAPIATNSIEKDISDAMHIPAAVPLEKQEQSEQPKNDTAKPKDAGAEAVPPHSPQTSP